MSSVAASKPITLNAMTRRTVSNSSTVIDPLQIATLSSLPTAAHCHCTMYVRAATAPVLPASDLQALHV